MVGLVQESTPLGLEQLPGLVERLQPPPPLGVVDGGRTAELLTGTASWD